MKMKQMRKLYRHEHGTRGVCPICHDKQAVREMKRCCADGSVTVYRSPAPGLRAFARTWSLSPSVCSRKLATIVEKRRAR